MASTNGDNTYLVDILTDLGRQANRYDFYAALRGVECHFRDKPRLGHSLRPVEDGIRLGQEPSSLFAPSTLHSCQSQADGYLHLNVLFFGLFGPQGPLPQHLTEYVRERRRNEVRDEATLQFMNLFHHRLLSLVYRAWANKEPTVQRDRPETDHFHAYIGSLLGIGIPELQNRDAMPDDSKRYFAAYLGGQGRHVSGLLALLTAFFQVPSQIEEFAGEWLQIPAESQSCLGRPLGTQLGVDTVLGQYSWQRQYKFRICLGPMDLADYENLLPGKPKLQLLGAMVRNYLGDELNWEVGLVLRKDEIPAVCLGQYGQLGLTSWLAPIVPVRDADDLAVGCGRLQA
jgi:type VI secretion system protein ImpH